MNIVFAGLKTTGKVETVWAVMNLGVYTSPDRDHPSYNYGHYTSYNYAIVWGRRGGKLRTLVRRNMNTVVVHERIFNPEFELTASHMIAQRGYGSRLIEKIFKMYKKGYLPVQADKLSDVYPEFEKDLDKIHFWQQFKL